MLTTGAPLRYIGKMSFLRMVPEGSSVDLSCELSDPTVAVTLWHMLGSGGMYTPRKNLAKYGQLYTLHRVSNAMKGTYMCRARQPRFFQNIGRVYIKPAPKGNWKLMHTFISLGEIGILLGETSSHALTLTLID